MWIWQKRTCQIDSEEKKIGYNKGIRKYKRQLTTKTAQLEKSVNKIKSWGRKGYSG